MRSVAALLGVVLTCALAACTTKAPGEPLPSGGGPTETTTTAAGTTTTAPSAPADVPRVANPVEGGKFAENPCLMLTPQQADELGVDHPGKPETSGVGTMCVWTNESRGRINITWMDQNGLDGVYAANDRGEYVYFEPIPDLGGHPAVVWFPVDRRDTGNCTLSVGTSDDEMFILHLRQSADKVDANTVCDVAERVAGMALDTLKAG